MRLSLIRTAAVAVALALVPAADAWAQLPAENGAPTRAGTKIVNTATVTFTDANNNTYDPVTGSLELEVAFVAGVDIAATQTPQPNSPGTGNWIEYTLTNMGNDVDHFTVSVDAGKGITVTGFSVVHPDDAQEGDWFTNLANFNNFLAQDPQHRDYEGNNGRGANIGTPDPNTSLVIYVRYDLDADFNTDEQLVVTVASGTDQNTSDTTDAGESTLDPEYVYDIQVTAEDDTQSRLPTNPGVTPDYQAVFTVENKASGSNFNWSVTAAPGSAITIIGVTGTDVSGGPESGTLTLGSGQSVDVTVAYTVASDADAGTTENLVFAVELAGGGESDEAETQVRVIRPALTITKAAFKDKAGEDLGVGGVVPGDTIWYKITVTNADEHGADAAGVEIIDEIPSALLYVSSQVDADNTGSWTVEVSGTNEAGPVTVKFRPVDGSNNPRPMAPGETAVFWIQVKVR